MDSVKNVAKFDSNQQIVVCGVLHTSNEII